MKNNNVSIVSKHNLCCSCGVCRGVCPTSAISYYIDKNGFIRPSVHDNCTNCGLCLKCCPGANQFRSTVTDDKLISGFSLNDIIRHESASGGMLTEILCYMIEKKVVDYVTVVTNYENGEYPKVVLTNNIETIKNCKTSKYCPIDYGLIIKEINKIEGRVAIVGIPCVINSIRQYARFNKKISNKVRFYLSLFCNHTPSYLSIEYLKVSNNISRFDRLLFRGDGWPGYFQFFNNGVKIKEIPYRFAMRKGVGRYFKNIRCEFCDDPFCDTADISFGDAYFCKNEIHGQTLAIVRNIEIENFLKLMKGDKIDFRNIDNWDSISQYYKKLIWRHSNTPEFTYYLNKMGHKSFFYSTSSIKPSLLSRMRTRKKLFMCSIGKYRLLWKLLYYYADR
jgi:coenzyme F420 hydrogenase subunit beta